MALFHGPSMILNGLVLYVDAANPRSYPRTGTTWFDLSGFGNQGTLTNTPTFSLENGGRFSFNGSTQRVDCPNSASLQITVGSIGAWFRANNTNSGFNGIIAKQFAWGLFVTDNTLTAYDWGNGVNRPTGITVGNDSWNFAAMTFTQTVGTPSNNAVIYLNGAAVMTTTIRHFDQSAPLQIGDANASQCFGGDISAGFVYNRVLSSNEVAQNFNALRGRFGV